MLSADVTARIDHVCEHHRGPAEDIVLQLHSRVDRDIVLYLYIVSDAYTWANNHILSEVAILAQTSPAHNVREVPNLCAVPNVAACIDDGGGVRMVPAGAAYFDGYPILPG